MRGERELFNSASFLRSADVSFSAAASSAASSEVFLLSSSAFFAYFFGPLFSDSGLVVCRLR
jgi:hypothetical protein